MLPQMSSLKVRIATSLIHLVFLLGETTTFSEPNLSRADFVAKLPLKELQFRLRRR